MHYNTPEESLSLATSDRAPAVNINRCTAPLLAAAPLLVAVGLQLGQVLDRRVEVEVGREELGGARQHQLVRLPDGDVSHAGDVADLLLGLLVL